MGILSPSSRVSTGPRFFPTGEFLTRSEPGVRQTPSSKESIITSPTKLNARSYCSGEVDRQFGGHSYLKPLETATCRWFFASSLSVPNYHSAFVGGITWVEGVGRASFTPPQL